MIWYVRGRMAFLWEVEWTAMLGDTVLRRHARMAADERVVRFCVVLPERVELVRYKLERSPLLRAELEEGGWHLVKADHLREWVGREQRRRWPTWSRCWASTRPSSARATSSRCSAGRAPRAARSRPVR